MNEIKEVMRFTLVKVTSYALVKSYTLSYNVNLEICSCKLPLEYSPSETKIDQIAERPLLS